MMFRPTITGTKLRRYLRCRRLPYMDAHVDPSLAVTPAAFYGPLSDLVDEPERGGAAAKGLSTAVAIRAERDGATRLKPGRTATAAAAATVASMRAGKRSIVDGLLSAADWWGKPAVLTRTDTPSHFGPWAYRTSDERRYEKVNSVRSIAIPNAFFAEILHTTQGLRPASFDMYEPFSGRTREIPLEPHRDVMLATVDAIAASLELAHDPGPDIRIATCGACRWQKECDREARKTRSLTMLTGSRRGTVEHLERHGITDTEALSKHPRGREILAAAPYVRVHVDKTFAQASAFDSGKVSLVGTSELPDGAEGEVFVDIETEGMDNRLDGTVFGILIRRPRRKPYLKVHIAEGPRDRRRAWNAFLADLQGAPPGAPIFHYAALDRNVMEAMLPKRAGERVLLARMHDVHPETARRAVIPDKSSSLKAVAKALGIVRRHDVNGRDAPLLWQEMVETGSKRIRRILREYNEDDLQMLAEVTDWLRSDRAGAGRRTPMLPPRPK